jgi:ketosteroid isomerase-like protein
MTPEELTDLEEIKRVKYAYFRCLDQKDWAGMEDVLCPDATAAYSGGKYSFDGRDEILGFLDRSMSRETFHSSHRVHHPEITVDGDRATGTWALEDIVVDDEWKFMLMGAAFYEDTYERRDGRWQILRTTYKRSFEVMFPTKSIEGFQLTASWWGTNGQSTLPAG